MNAYFMHDRIEERTWQEHYLQIAREEEEAELADLYDRQIKFHHLHTLLSNTRRIKPPLPQLSMMWIFRKRQRNSCGMQPKRSRPNRLQLTWI